MIEEQRPHHEMVLEETRPTGVQEWFCPSCGRRLLLQWPPAWKMVVLSVGDSSAGHDIDQDGTYAGHLDMSEFDDIQWMAFEDWLETSETERVPNRRLS